MSCLRVLYSRGRSGPRRVLPLPAPYLYERPCFDMSDGIMGRQLQRVALREPGRLHRPAGRSRWSRPASPRAKARRPAIGTHATLACVVLHFDSRRNRLGYCSDSNSLYTHENPDPPSNKRLLPYKHAWYWAWQPKNEREGWYPQVNGRMWGLCVHQSTPKGLTHYFETSRSVTAITASVTGLVCEYETESAVVRIQAGAASPAGPI